MRRSLILTLGVYLGVCAMTAAAGYSAISIPPGTTVLVRLNNELNTGTARAGQSFSGTMAQPLVINGRTVLPRGASVRGRVLSVVSSGRLKRPASITLELIEANGQSVQCPPLRIDGKSHVLRNTEAIGGESAAGAIIGAIAGGKNGALIGAAVGAGAGTATAYLTGKKEIVLPAETTLDFASSGAATESGYNGSRSYSRSYRPAESAQAYNGGERRPTDNQSEDYGRGYQGQSSRRQYREPEQGPTFASSDQVVIRRYFEEETSNLPPGLAKRGGNLPPGLERHLEKYGTLPPGLQRRVEPFPEDLSSQLPPLPGGYSRVVLGNKALILDAASRILDIMLIR